MGHDHSKRGSFEPRRASELDELEQIHGPSAAKPASPGMRPLIKSQPAPAPVQRKSLVSQIPPREVPKGPVQDWTNAVFRPDLYTQPIQRKSLNEGEAVTPAQVTRAPEVDGERPPVEGAQPAAGPSADATERAPEVAGPGDLPPEHLLAPEDYPGVAHILDMEESVLAIAPPESGKSSDKDAKDGKDSKKTETETGIATQVALDRFVVAAKDVEKNWGTLNKTSRAEKLGEAANSELATAGVPKVGIVIKDLGSTNGQLDFTPWNLDLNGKRFEPNAVTTDAMAPVARTVYHESRHAEQWFRMARIEAGKGKKGAAIASALSIKRAVADEAEKKPLSGNSQEAKEAASWHKSVYGADGTARNQTLRNLSKHGKEMRDALKKSQETATAYKKLKAEKGADAPETKAGAEVWKTAHAAYEAAKSTFDTTYAAYQALPEEADAWKLGDRVMTAYKGS